MNFSFNHKLVVKCMNKNTACMYVYTGVQGNWVSKTVVGAQYKIEVFNCVPTLAVSDCHLSST